MALGFEKLAEKVTIHSDEVARPALLSWWPQLTTVTRNVTLLSRSRADSGNERYLQVDARSSAGFLGSRRGIGFAGFAAR